MSKKLLLGTLVLLLGMCVRMNAQLVTLTEDFEQGLPTTWTQDPASGVTAWSVSNSGLTGVTAHGGSNYVSLFTTNQQADTKLVLPNQDISSLSTPELSFFLVQKARGVNTSYARDTLRIYARSSSTAAWTLVQTLSDEVTIWSRQRVDLSAVASGTLQVAFEFVYGSGLGIGIDDIRLGDATVCFTPNNLQAFRVTSNSAELMWNAYEAAYEYGLKVSTTAMSDMTATANVFDQTVYFKPYAITGLTPSTTYYFYVNANCGEGDVSAWSEAGTFTTACAPQTLPYTDPMEANSTYATCWTKYWEANGDWSATTPSASTYAPAINTTHHAGTQSVRLYAYYYNATSYASPRTIKSYVATHEMNTTDIRNQQVTFWCYGSTINAKVHVGVMSDPGDFSTFEEIALVKVDAASTWKEYTIPLNAATNPAANHICFMTDGADGTASFYFYIDDVLVEDIPLCPKPAMVRTGVVTHERALINWMGNSSAYNVKVSTTALADPTTDTPDVLSTTVNTNSINITGLTAKTTYYVYVRANCNAEGNGTSPWANALQFTTTGVVAMPPYTCGFEDPADNAQWDFYNGTVTNQWVIGSAINHGGNSALYISPNGGATAEYTINGASSVAVSRALLLPPGNHGISFDWQAGGESTIDYLRAELAPSNATFTAGTTATGTATTSGFGGILLSPVKMNLSNGWQHLDYMVTVTDTTSYNLVFYWRNDGSIGTQPGAVVDNVTIETYNCTSPTAIATGTPTANGTTLSWTPGAETQWQVQVMQGANVVLDTVVTTTSLLVDNLPANTAFTARVRGLCSATDFGWWTSGQFTTACDDIRTLPYSEDFQSYGTGTNAKPNCWTYTQQYSSYPYVPTTAYNHTPNAGTTGSFYFYATTSASNCVALPRLSVPGKTIQDVQMSFYMLVTTLTYSMTVGVMTDPTDFSTFSPVQSFTCDATSSTTNQNWKYIELDFTNYTGNGQYIAFYDGTRGAANYVYIDDILVELIPTCPRPKSVVLDGTTENSVTVSFQGNTGATFEAVVVNRGNEINANNIVASATSTTNTITVRGLNPLTNYDCYVRSICGAGDTSMWSIVVPFSTTSAPEALPLFTDFTNTTDNAKWQFENGTQVNKWYIGSAVGNGDSKSLYISETSGTSNTYTITTACYNYAYRLFKFTPGIYEISFDWACGGEGTYDFIRAFLVPANEVFTAGSAGRLSAATTVPAGWISLNGLKGYFNDPTATSSQWKSVQEIVTIPDTTNMFLLFYWKNDASGGTQPAGAVDNVSIQPLSCASVLSIDKTDTEAVFSFTPSMGTPTGYEIAIDNQPINLSNLTGIFYHTISTAAVDTIHNLTGNTQYYGFVRTICGSDTGRWITADFRTECALLVPPVTLDLEDNNSTGTGTTPFCWTHVTGGNYPYVYNNRSYNGGSKCIYFYQSSTATTEPNMVAMPRLDVDSIQNFRMEFYIYYASTVSYGLIVGVMDDPANPNSFVPVDTVWTTQNGVWEQQTVHFRNYTGNGKYIALRTDYGLRSAVDYIYVDYFTIEEDRLCQTPNNLSVSNLSGNGATLNWGAVNGLTYDVIVSTAEINPDTVTAEGGNVFMYETEWNTNSLDLSGMLQTNRTYWFYVKAECNAADGKPSLWSEGYQFTTICPAYTLPYTQEFVTPRPNNGAMPACWQTILEVTGVPTGTPAQIVEPEIYGGSNCYQKSATDSCSLRMGCYYSTTASSKTLAILPEFTGSYAGHKLSFYTACTASANGVIGGRLLVGTVTDVTDASTFETIDTVVNTNYWNYHAVALDNVANTNGKRLALLWDGDLNQRSGYYYIDHLAIEPYASCEAPVNPHANVNGGTADIYVSTISPADSLVHIELLRESTLVKDTVMNVANLPWRVTGLSGLTTFQIRARVLCNRATSTYSAYTYRTVEFTTGCAPVSLPYSYNFDNEPQSGSGKRPTNCWTAYQTNGATSYPYVYSTYSVSSPYSLYLYGTTSYSAVAVLPELNVTSMQNVLLSMQVRKTSTTSDLRVGVMTDPEDMNTFVTVATIAPTAITTWQELNVSFADYTGSGRYIALATGGTKTSTIMVDDIFVEYEPTCHRPSSPSFVTNTTTSITATWNAGPDGETQWDITALPTGRRPDANTPYTTVNTTTGTVTGLQPNVVYDFFVRAACSATDHSSWSSATMRTSCVAFNVTDSTTFFEEFDSDGTGSGAHPSCWTTLTNYTTAYPYISTTHNSGVGSLYFYATSTYYSYAVTPELTGTPIQQLELNFMGRAANLTYYLEVGVMTDPNDPSTFTLMSTITPDATSTWEPERVRFSAYTGTGRYIAFRIPPKSTAYYYVDDVEIATLGACASPDVRFNEINSDSVDIQIFPVFPTDSVWQIVVTPPATTPTPDMNSAIINRTVNHLHDTITGFPYNTTYTLYARTVCGTANTQWTVYNVKTPCGPQTIDATHPFLELFDNYGTGAGHTPDCWTVLTTGATIPYCSTSYKQSGVASLYFYNATGNTTTAATPRIVGTPVRELEMNLKLYQTSSTPEIEVGVMTNPNDQSTFIPTGRIKATATATWTDITVRFATYTGTAEYIALRANGVTSTNYIDNIQISVVPPCSGPGLDIQTLAYDDVRLTIAGANPADTVFEYVITPAATTTTPNMGNAVARDTVGNGTYTLTTLPAGNSLTVYARSLCGNEWSRMNFNVPCVPFLIDDTHSLSDDFDNYGTTSYVSFPNCWSRGTNATSQYPYITTTHNSGVGSMYFYATSSYYSYAATPQIIGTPLNQLRLEFVGRKTSAAYFLEIGAMTDPGDYSTFVPIDTVTCSATSTWENFVVDLLGYTGNAQYVAFRVPQGATDYFYIDDLEISKIPGCSFPGINASFNSGTMNLEILPAKPQDTEWEIVINQSTLANDTTGSIFHQVVTSTTVAVPNVNYASTYYIHASTHCGNEWSEWGVTPFTTPCGVITLPYTEQFGVVPPSCWWLRNGLIDNVMNGTDSLGINTGIWLANNTGNGLPETHIKVNNYGTTRKHWLITPDIFVDTTAVLKFDMALTDYNNGNVIDNFGNQPDDRFMVAVSRDGGITWNRSDLLAEWNNSGSPLVYDNIPTNGQTVEFALNNFIGDTIKIGFYVESTVSNGDNDFHLGNVNVIAIRNIVDYTDNVCDGYNYVGHDFTIASSEISLTGENVFTRVSNDTMYRLTLNVTPSVEIEINDTICAGNLPYTLYGFNVTAGGTHQRFLNTVAGCDSIITLNLVVNPGYTDNQSVVICSSALPYLWNGQSLTAAGVYTHTVAGPDGCDSVFTLTLGVNQDVATTVDIAICDNELPYTWNGQSLTAAGTYTHTATTLSGCDSVVTLNLTVNATYSNTEYLTLHDYELPYTWNGQEITAAGSYTFNGTTAEGCDSVITLTLTVTVGLDYAEDGMFAISPNPVQRGGSVRLDVSLTEAEREGVVVEIFTAAGKLVNRFEPKEEPMFVTMPEADGLYMVRLTTGTGRVMYGKVIVK